jgi:peptidoglycan/LPS O-acetylase OafA/YrhL
VIAVTVVASALVLSRLRLPDVAGDAAAAAVYVANYRFAINATDYLASSGAPSPLLHYWSLGVEEQFYLVWPLLIMIGARLVSVRRLAWLILPIALGSLALSIAWTDIAAPWAFFSLPTRAWELAIGALIALGLLRLPSRVPVWLASTAGLLGLALIGAAVLIVNGSTPYPGVAALLPVTGAALLIVSGERAGALTARALATTVPRWFGRISYSLYLWHWPLLILVPVVLGRDDLAVRVALGLAAIGIAAASTAWVEAPFREGRLRRVTPKRSVTLAGAASLVLAAAALAIGGILPGFPTGPSVVAFAPHPTPAVEPSTGTASPPTTATPSLGASAMPGSSASASPASPPAPTNSAAPGDTPPPSSTPEASLPNLPPALLSGPLPGDLQPPLQDAAKDLPVSYSDGCHLDFFTTDPPPCVYGDSSSRTTVVLIGDSHAAQWLPALQVLARRHDWRLVSLTKSACPVSDVQVWNQVLKREYRECDAWHQRVLARVADEHPALAVVASASGYELVDSSGRTPVAQNMDAWHAGLADFLGKVAQQAGRVVYIAEDPHLPFDPLDCLASHAQVDGCPSARSEVVDTAYAGFEAALTSELGIQLVSPTDWLCPGDACPLVRGKYLVFRDDQHLTATWVELLAPLLNAAIGPLP